MMWKRLVVAGVFLAAALLLVPGTSRAEGPLSVSASTADFSLTGFSATGEAVFAYNQVSNPVLGAGLTNMALLTGNFLDLLRYFLYRFRYHSYDDDDDDNHHKVPEPATMILFGSGLLGVAGLSRLRRFKK
jgi:hypothetical protein